MERHSIQVSYRLNGMRLDAALSESITGLSRRKAKAIIDLGGVYVNKKRSRIASRTVGKGDRIDVEYNPLSFDTKREATKVGLTAADILFENDDFLAINKPAGLPSQATRDQSVYHVCPLLETYLEARGDKKRTLHLVHRLDKDTTGVILVAKTKDAMTILTEKFRLHQMEKTYEALSWGLAEPEFSVRCYLSAIQAHTGKVKVVSSGGKSSETHFRTLQRFPQLGLSHLACEPKTGRSHQIRVHLDASGLPIVGDKVYGEGKRQILPDELLEVASHQLLHAASLRFSYQEGGEPIHIQAPYPETFARFLALAQASLLTP